MTNKNRIICPCCGYLTLTEHAGFEICSICGWEDNGQDDSNCDVVMGGRIRTTL